MGIGLVFERANKDVYDALVAADGMSTGSELANAITNVIFPTILDKVGDTIGRPDSTDRNYAKFKMPLSEYGLITEYLVSSMIRAADPSGTDTGTAIDDFVINNPKIQGLYANKIVRANYPLTVQSERWLDALDNRNLSTLAAMVAMAAQSLYDGVTHDHDAMIPALCGTLYGAVGPESKRTIPKYTGDDVEGYSKSVFAVLNKAIRDMTQWRRPDFNIVKADMSDSKADLVLVAFDNPVSDNVDATVLDVITSQLNIGPLARAVALGNALGVEVYEMPSMGIISNSVARAYSMTNFPGMQTADMSSGIQTPPNPEVKFALMGRGALNAGLKRLQTDTGRSIRGHFDQTWVQPSLQLSWGAGQVIFFEDAEVEPTPHTVTYMGNGNTGGSAPTETDKLPGDTVTVKANTFTKTGFTFVNWVGSNGVEYEANDTFSMPDSNFTLTAQWSPA